MVRHEAGEALGAIGQLESISVLEDFLQDPNLEVSETCQIAIDRIKYLTDRKKETIESCSFISIDPAPPETLKDIQKLKQQLLNQSLSLFKRYRAMFSLRNIGGVEAVEALCEGFQDSSALFRHEIAYVLGQMQDPIAINALTCVLKKSNENGMVRHEAAEALGSIGTQDCLPLLESHLTDNERVVRESCFVALDIYDYVNSDQFEYGNSLKKLHSNN